MGAEGSSSLLMADGRAYTQLDSKYMQIKDQNKSGENNFESFINAGYSKQWCKDIIIGQTPSQRIGQATAYDSQQDKAYIAYGSTQDKSPLDDL